MRRKNLSLKDKQDLIEMYYTHKKTVKELMIHFQCGKTQVYDCLSKKEEIKKNFSMLKSPGIKRIRSSEFDKLNDVIFQWFCTARTKSFPISGPIIQAKALEVASKMNFFEFKASNGWLRSFRKRFKISFRSVCGESNDVPENVMAEWLVELEEMCTGFEPKNIANCDETGLFFRLLPSKSLALSKGIVRLFTFFVDNRKLFNINSSFDDFSTNMQLIFCTGTCSGGKNSKERITVLFTMFGDGSIAEPLVIGKSLNPRCFKNLKRDKLGVDYFANKRAWMTSLLFEQYLTKLNKKMQTEDRTILLFLDNATSHPNIQLSNITLKFFPPNTTSKLQPLDGGVIANFKVNYKKLMLQNLLHEMESCENVSALTKKINILDSINIIKQSCAQISPSTVIKCFLNAGFLFDNDDEVCDFEETENANNLDLIEIQNLIQTACGSSLCSAMEYVTVDDDVTTESDSIDIDEIIDSCVNSNDGEVVTISESDDEDDIVQEKDVASAIKTLQTYGRQTGNNVFYDATNSLKILHMNKKNQIRKKKQSQTSILDFVSKVN